MAGCILDLGCGDGRVAIPLARAGCTVVAVDHDPAAIDALRANLRSEDESTRGRVQVMQADLALLNVEQIRSVTDLPIVAALCLGHTFMLLHDPLDALGLMRMLRELVVPGGWLAIDDFPHDLWYEVSEGNWQAGMAEVEPEDGGPSEVWQMVWKPGDPVIALRRGDEVDPDAVELLETDRLHRLYSIGELRLLAACSGFEPPVRAVDDALLVFTAAHNAR